MSALDGALDRGDAATAWRLAGLLKPEAITLDYALALLVLATDDPELFERGAARWLERWTHEHPRASTAELTQLTATLDGLPALEGVTSLAGLCETLQLPRAAATLIHLYPAALQPAARSAGSTRTG